MTILVFLSVGEAEASEIQKIRGIYKKSSLLGENFNFFIHVGISLI